MALETDLPPKCSVYDLRGRPGDSPEGFQGCRGSPSDDKKLQGTPWKCRGEDNRRGRRDKNDTTRLLTPSGSADMLTPAKVPLKGPYTAVTEMWHDYVN